MQAKLIRISILYFQIAVFIILFSRSTNADEVSPWWNSFAPNGECECWDAADSIRNIIPHYKDNEKWDSLKSSIDYVREICKADVFYRTRFLLAIETDDLSYCLPDSEFVGEISSIAGFHGPMRCLATCHDLLPNETSRNYDNYIPTWAKELISKSDSLSLKYTLCRYLSGDIDFLFKRLSKNSFPNTYLQNWYISALACARYNHSILRQHRAIYSGTSFPLNSKENLGQSYEIGFNAGVKMYRLGFDMFLGMHYTVASRTYKAQFGDIVASGNRYLHGMTYGIRPSYELHAGRRFETELMFDIGCSNFIILNQNNHNQKSTKYSSLYKWGIIQRIYYNRDKTHFIGLQLCHNILSFDHDSGTDLFRSAISLSLVWGFLGDKDAIFQNRLIHYNDWKGKIPKI